MESAYLGVVAACFGVASFVISTYVLVRYRPDEVFRRLESVEDDLPRTRQLLHAWTVETETMLERCEVKLRTAHQRKGGRPPKAPEPQQELPQQPISREQARQQQLAMVRAELARRGLH